MEEREETGLTKPQQDMFQCHNVKRRSECGSPTCMMTVSLTGHRLMDQHTTNFISFNVPEATLLIIGACKNGQLCFVYYLVHSANVFDSKNLLMCITYSLPHLKRVKCNPCCRLQFFSTPHSKIFDKSYFQLWYF